MKDFCNGTWKESTCQNKDGLKAILILTPKFMYLLMNNRRDHRTGSRTKPVGGAQAPCLLELEEAESPSIPWKLLCAQESEEEDFVRI